MTQKKLIKPRHNRLVSPFKLLIGFPNKLKYYIRRRNKTTEKIKLVPLRNSFNYLHFMARNKQSLKNSKEIIYLKCTIVSGTLHKPKQKPTKKLH